jgi:ATP-dependent DNA ligase
VSRTPPGGSQRRSAARRGSGREPTRRPSAAANLIQAGLEAPVAPMEALTAEVIPQEEGWQYEPKWDGFRCVAVRDGERAVLWSKSGQPLGRYFPDVVANLERLGAARFVLDGELVIEVDGELVFGELQLRLHPAESRVRKLAAAHPATYVVFDLLADERGRDLTGEPLADRRERLAAFAKRWLGPESGVALSPVTRDAALAERWLAGSGAATDGVVAKVLDLPYLAAERRGMVKVKRLRTADCVVGGFRWAESSRLVGSLLLGLYDDEGRLDNVGFTSGIHRAERAALTARLLALEGGPGFTGASPGGPSRWSARRDTSYVPLRHELVAEVEYDHFTGGRFRHGTRLVRFRPDKAPAQCRFDQIAIRRRVDLAALLGTTPHGGVDTTPGSSHLP